MGSVLATSSEAAFWEPRQKLSELTMARPEDLRRGIRYRQ